MPPENCLELTWSEWFKKCLYASNWFVWQILLGYVHSCLLRIHIFCSRFCFPPSLQLSVISPTTNILCKLWPNKFQHVSAHTLCALHEINSWRSFCCSQNDWCKWTEPLFPAVDRYQCTMESLFLWTHFFHFFSLKMKNLNFFWIIKWSWQLQTVFVISRVPISVYSSNFSSKVVKKFGY